MHISILFAALSPYLLHQKSGLQRYAKLIQNPCFSSKTITKTANCYIKNTVVRIVQSLKFDIIRIKFKKWCIKGDYDCSSLIILVIGGGKKSKKKWWLSSSNITHQIMWPPAKLAAANYHQVIIMYHSWMIIIFNSKPTIVNGLYI